VAATVVCALAVPSLSLAAPLQDSVTGSIAQGGGSFPFFSVNAHSGPSGEAPTGTLTYSTFTPSNSENLQSSTISCLAVTGKTAVVGGFGVLRTRGLGPNGPVETTTNTGFVAVISDNGQVTPPPPGQPFPFSPDTFVLSFVTTPDCAAPPSGGDRSFPGNGDLAVVDAQPPMPTSKDQCKDGGWRNFGETFRNQGQCVAFVERGPKP
jgi:hypothetical protein